MSLEWILVDLEQCKVRAAEGHEATHVAIELYRGALAKVRELEEKNQALHAKLQKQIQNKRNWRDRAEKAERGEGGKRGRLQAKKLILYRWDAFFSVRTVELDAETEVEATRAAMDYKRQELNGSGAMVHQITHNGVEWIAEFLIPIRTIAERLIPALEDQ